MALLITKLAGTIERTLDTLVGTIGFVVTDLTAVEAFSSETAAAALGLLWAVTGEVTGFMTAVDESVRPNV